MLRHTGPPCRPDTPPNFEHSRGDVRTNVDEVDPCGLGSIRSLSGVCQDDRNGPAYSRRTYQQER